MPRGLHLSLERAQALRYGENPHQQGARYRIEGRKSWWDDAVQHGGKELSYLNLFDTEAAWPRLSIVKAPGDTGLHIGPLTSRTVATAVIEAVQTAD